MRSLFLAIALFFLVGVATAQAGYPIPGYPYGNYGPYDYGPPIISTPVVQFQDAPLTAGATNATRGNHAGAQNATGSYNDDNGQEMASQVTGAYPPQYELTDSDVEIPRGIYLGASQTDSAYNASAPPGKSLADLAAEYQKARRARATRVITNQDLLDNKPLR